MAAAAAAAERCNRLLLLVFLLFAIWCVKTVHCKQSRSEPLLGLRSSQGLEKKLNILMVTFHVTGHVVPLISLGQELQSRGHTVTIAAQQIEGDQNPEKLIRESGLGYCQAGSVHMSKPEFEKLLEDLAKNPVNLLAGFQMFARLEVDLYQKLDPLFAAKEQAFGDVDIIIADGMTETGVWLAHEYNLPVVINDPHSFAAKLPPSLTYPTFPSGFDARMPFLKRLANSLFYAVGWGLNSYKDRQVQKLVTERGIVEPPGYKFLSASIAGRYVAEPVLVNTVPGLDFPTEAGPNLFFVGPLVSSTIQPVPQDIATWLADRESNGDPTVLVSFGSSAHLDVKQGRTFLQGLIDAGVHAIWPCRLTNRAFFDGITVPERIRIEKWVPQQAILNHSAVSGYVGHCGTGGTHQTLAFGKPVVCIPFMADHFETAARIRSSGAGRSFSLQVLSSADSGTVTEAIASITTANNSYQKSSQRVAGLMEAYGGVKAAANVVEFIAAFGYDHLKVARWELGWGPRHSLDVILVWTALVGFVLWMGLLAARQVSACVRVSRKPKTA